MPSFMFHIFLVFSLSLFLECETNACLYVSYLSCFYLFSFLECEISKLRFSSHCHFSFHFPFLVSSNIDFKPFLLALVEFLHCSQLQKQVIEGMGRKLGTRDRVKEEETLSQTLQDFFRGVKGSQQGHNKPPRENEHATACSGKNQSMVQRRILRSTNDIILAKI